MKVVCIDVDIKIKFGGNPYLSGKPLEYGKVYEGEFEIAKDEEDLVKFLIDDDNQDELITLEGKLKTKKLAAI